MIQGQSGAQNSALLVKCFRDLLRCLSFLAILCCLKKKKDLKDLWECKPLESA